MSTNLKSNNPFRTTPNPTGLPPTSPPPSTSTPTSYAPPPGSPPRPRPPSPPRVDSLPLAAEDAPPAYTPAADVYQGESTVEFGPRRPFQQAPAPIPPPQHRSQRPPPPQQATGGSWSAYPGQNISLQHSASSSSSFRPPPTQLSPPLPPRPASTSPVSEFARDFYEVGGDVDLGEGGSGGGNRYAPPPGDPPRRGGQGNVPDDGKPTRTPVPGHPLLKDGRMLVFPPGYECPKCHNTGYKNFDPSHPCKRCWERYARPYAGALAYAPAPGSSAPTPAAAGAQKGSTFQRPLPAFRPPAQAPVRTQSTLHRPPPVPATRSSFSPPSGPPPAPLHVRTLSASRAPPGSTVVRPGDARIGGSLCWKCAGRGQVSFFLFEEVACPVCGGIGRMF